MPGPANDDDLTRVLDADGRVVDGASIPDLDDRELVEMYAEMRFARRFDERAVSLQRQGRLGTYPPLAGQEGAQVGSAHALREDDWVVDQYREHGVFAVRGLGPEYLRYWMGHEEGNAWLAERNVFPLNIAIASHVPHAVGMAWASKLKGEDRVFCCHFGDGATSEGDFHEGLNFAGVFEVPCVFLCHNNGWAISVPRERQTASETLAVKARAYGFEGVRVDGMDPLAVYRVTRDAVEVARGGGGPTLIEAVQYRYGAHTTADDPDRYRDAEEVEQWRTRDPIDRFAAFLRSRDLLDDERAATIEEGIEEALAELIEAAEDVAADPDAMFEHVYGTATPGLEEQQVSLRTLRERHGDGALLEDG